MMKMFRNTLLGSLAIFLSLAVPQVHAAVVVNETVLVSGTYTVPNDGQVTITITGADGGEGSTTQGGSGSTVTSIFDVISGQVIRYVVGEAGNTHAGSSAGGGGSTGVYIDTMLVMVAGAGGGGDNSTGAVGLGGNTGTAGDSGTGGGAGTGGTGGNGGGANSDDSAGGGGINSSGGSAAAGGGGQAVSAPALPGLLVIAQGGSGAGTGSAGGDGFSGGGGADTYYSGGAGGYSGGGAAGSGGSAGGGGSYVNTGMTGYVSSTLTAGGDGAGSESDGSIVIDYTGPGLNPLPSGDTNDALPVCGAAGRDGGGNISGVVNTYYPVTASVNAGATTITLGSSTGSSTPLAAGDTVMIIQMQDAVINSTNTTSYGDNISGTDPAGSTSIRQTGLYEFAIADSISGNTLTLTIGLTRAYHHGTNQRFQVVRVPRYTDVTLNGDVTAAAWNGTTGGIVALDATGSLDLNGNNIDVTGLGFRGGVYDGDAASDQRDLDLVIANNSTSPSYQLYAEKGEGIAGTPSFPGGLNGDGYPNGDLGAGAPGNGGGSGQSHNSGGGGGSNIGGGGRGGDSWPSASPQNGGFGGGTFDGYPGRLFLGGGGGAGNQNNETAGGGGAGGGIVFINGHTIIPNNGGIVANGTTGGSSASNDAAGGGGAAGTLLIRTASNSLSGLTFSVVGGNGGDVNFGGDGHGPGGGGGGGAVYLNHGSTGATFSYSGGDAGTNTSGTGGNHGATDGGEGHDNTFTQNEIPFMQSCDFGDAPTSFPSNYGIAGHIIDTADKAADALYIGSKQDFEWSNNPDADAAGDDDLETSNPNINNDEDGVTFSSPGGGARAEIIATVDIANNTGGNAYVCAWLDVWTDNNGSAVLGNDFTGTGDAKACQTVADNNGTAAEFIFHWDSLPSSSGHTYARFRVCTTVSECNSPTGTSADGEVEDYRVNFDFTPTAVTIGKVELEATRITDFLADLDVDQMDRAALLALLQAWDPAAAAALSDDASREEILAALRNYLDPDGDGQVAVLAWDTLEERGTIGFYVDRRQGEDAWIRINNDMLPGLINAPMGGEYRLADPGVTSGFFQYRLIEQEARGTTRSYGPYGVKLP